jgi:hypothetical protein
MARAAGCHAAVSIAPADTIPEDGVRRVHQKLTCPTQ